MATAFYAAIFGIMLIVFSLKAVHVRKKFGVSLGDGENIEINRCIRAQANFTEYAPIFVIILGYAEMNGLPIGIVNLFGMLFLAGRIMHAYSLLKHEQYDNLNKLVIHPKWRIRGMICTFTAIGTTAIIVLSQLAILIISRIN